MSLYVPFPTEVAPWIWVDAADRSCITASSNQLVSLQNKGTAVDIINKSGTGSIKTNLNTINNLSTFTFNGNVNLDAVASLNQTGMTVFHVSQFLTTMDTTTKGYMYFLGGGTSQPQIGLDCVNSFMEFGINAGSYPARGVITTGPPDVKLYSYSAGSSTSTNYLGVDASSVSLSLNTVLTSTNYGSRTWQVPKLYNITSAADIFALGESLIYATQLNLTQIMQVEGYLAWKWGTQTRLPSSHPFSVTNVATTLALYQRPRMVVSTLTNDIVGNSQIACDSLGNIYIGSSSGIYRVTPSGTKSFYYSVSNAWRIYIREDILYLTNYNNTAYKIIINPASSTPGTVTTFTGLGTSLNAIGADISGTIYVQNSTNIVKINPTTSAQTNFISNSTYCAYSFAFDDTNNDLYFTSAGSVIYKVISDGTVSVYAGVVGTTGNTDGHFSLARFNGACGLVRDMNGIMYLTETTNNKIRMIAPGGMVNTLVGPAPGTTSSAYVDGLDTTARFQSCESIAIDKNGNLYTAEFGNNRVRKISRGALHQVTTIANTGPFYGPTSCISDGYGNIYTSNWNYGSTAGGLIITKTTPFGVSSSWVGNTTSFSELTFNEGLGNAANIGRNRALVMDKFQNIYAYSNTYRILKISPAGRVFLVAGSGLNQTTDGTGSGASIGNYGNGLVVDSSQNIYVFQTYSSYIRKITPDRVVSTLTSFPNPMGACIDASNNIYIAAYDNKIYKMNTSGSYTVIAGSGTPAITDGKGTSASFKGPVDIKMDANGVFYISDNFNEDAHVIRRMTPDLTVTTIIGKAGVPGFTDGVGTNATLFQVAIGIDNVGNLLIPQYSSGFGIRVASINSPPTGLAYIGGSLRVGQTLSVDTSNIKDGDGLGTFSYQWSSASTQNDSYTNISGATSNSYTLTLSEVNKYIKVTLSFTDGRGTVESVSSSPVTITGGSGGITINGNTLEGNLLGILNTVIDTNGVKNFVITWEMSDSSTEPFTQVTS